jgi:hypothetical protein
MVQSEVLAAPGLGTFSRLQSQAPSVISAPIHMWVKRAPRTASRAHTAITKGRDVELANGPKEKAPTKAPSLPQAAAIPPNVDLISFGNVSAGRMKVVSMGPPDKEKSSRQ